MVLERNQKLSLAKFLILLPTRTDTRGGTLDIIEGLQIWSLISQR